MNASAQQRKDYLVFSLLFCVVSLMVFSIHIFEGKSLIWSSGVDGLNQHYSALVYEGMWLRDIAKSILSGHPEVRLWDFSIGYGSDVLTTMSYYALGDPLNLLSAVVPSRYTEVLFNALAVMRLWLAGLAFILYAHKMGYQGQRCVAGALSYAFCGYALFCVMIHPFFCNPLIYLPLLLTGVECIYQQRRPAPYLAAIFLSALGNYYFFYMLALCIAAYAVCRFFFLPHKNTVLEFLTTGVTFVVYSLVGVACAAFLLLPTITLLLSNSRANATLLHDTFYPVSYYAHFVPAFFGPGVVDQWKILGFSGPALLGVTCLLVDRKRHPFLLAAFLLMTGLFLVPAVGSFFNGMSYVNNRWSFAYASFVCMALVVEWDTLVGEPEEFLPSMVYVAVGVVLSCAASVAFEVNRGVFISLCLYLLAMLLILVMPCSRSSRLFETPQVRGATLTLLIAVGLYANAYNFYSVHGEGKVSLDIDSGTALESITETDSRAVRDAADAMGKQGMVRLDMDSYWETNSRSGVKHPTDNTSIFAGVSATQYYWSIVNAGTSQFMLDLQLPDILAQKVYDLDQRILPITLTAVNYEVVKGSIVPYGYTAIGEGSHIYTSELSLPIGYSYDSILPKSALKNADATVLQEAMMQSAIVNDDVYDKLAGTLATTEPVYRATSVPVKVKLVGDVARLDDTHYSACKGSKLKLSFEGQKNCETYLVVKGVNAEPKSDYELYMDGEDPLTPEQFSDKARIDQNALRWQSAMTTHWNTNGFGFVVSFDGGRTKDFIWRSPYRPWSDNMNDFVVNLGYKEEAQNACTIEFPLSGLYTIEDISIVCQPMDMLDEQVDALRESSLVDTWYGTNSFGGTIKNDETKLLCLAMPNEKGWSAKVDGKPTDIVDVNTMFMGVLLEPGDHKVELIYRTNLLVQGIVISIVGLVLLVAIVVLSHNRAPIDAHEDAPSHFYDGPNHMHL